MTLQTVAADLSAHARYMILGDFSLAPRESDGPVETILSTFTSACERSAFAILTHDHPLRRYRERARLSSRSVGLSLAYLRVSLRPPADSRLALALDHDGAL